MCVCVCVVEFVFLSVFAVVVSTARAWAASLTRPDGRSRGDAAPCICQIQYRVTHRTLAQMQLQLQLVVSAVNAVMKFEYVSSGNWERFSPGLTPARITRGTNFTSIHPRSSSLWAANWLSRKPLLGTGKEVGGGGELSHAWITMFPNILTGRINRLILHPHRLHKSCLGFPFAYARYTRYRQSWLIQFNLTACLALGPTKQSSPSLRVTLLLSLCELSITLFLHHSAHN